jgi:putative colanic acid biosynthesis UDP-glucose lipid carrier transferase
MIFRKGILNTHSSEVLFLFRLADLLVVLSVGIGSFYLVNGAFPTGPTEKIFLLFAVLGFAIFAEWLGVYASGRGRRFSSELIRVTLIGLLTFSLAYILRFILAGSTPDKTTNIHNWLFFWFIGLLAAQLGLRYTLRKALGVIRARGFNLRHVVLAGNSICTEKISRAVSEHPEFGIDIEGYFDDREVVRDNISVDYPRLGPISNLAEYVQTNNIDQVWLAYPAKGEERSRFVISELRHLTVDIRYILDTSSLIETSSQCDTEATLTEFGGLPLLDIEVSPLEGFGRYIKTIEDKILSALALLALSPLLAIIAIGVKLSSPGPIFFRQERISWNNHPFTMYKFRSMPIDVEKDTGPKWASKGENRATPFGSFLRKTSLDELPQFFNVLLGDMSIVGPRPERPIFVEQYKDEIPAYMKKHMMKAGITGWAQVNGLRGDTDLNERIKYDIYYIRHWSLMFDIDIGIRTIFKGFINRNAY